MNARTIYRLLVPVLLTAAVTGCIKNDIPYPRRLGKITAFEVEDQLGSAAIDSTSRTVSVEVSETVDLSQVRLVRFEMPENTVASPSPDEVSVLDLREPMEFVLTTWPGQEYIWTVSAMQNVDRYIRVENQARETAFNLNEKQAVIYVSLDQPKNSIVITDMKLGPSDAVMTPDFTTVHDFTSAQEFTVTYREVTEVWTVYAMNVEVALETGEADAWASVAYLEGMVPDASEAPGFRWRRADSDQWQEVPSSDITVDGTAVSAVLTGLEPGTEYVYKVYAGVQEGSEVSFTTETAAQMPNMGFDAWNTTNGVVFPNADQGDNFWWDSGNTGAKIGGKTPTSQETSFLAVPGEGKSAARLETVNAIIAMAGGNVFSGHFGGVQGLGAEVFFGRPFETRPTKLTGWYSYEPKAIDNVKPPEGVALPFDRNTIAGRKDRCHIFVYVTAWDGPYRVNTTEHRYLDINDPDVIGYGELIDSTGTGGQYRQFSIDIKYRDHRKPTYCAVVAVASQYADFFTGGIGSLMYVDEFAFGYDGTPVWEEDAQQ